MCSASVLSQCITRSLLNPLYVFSYVYAVYRHHPTRSFVCGVRSLRFITSRSVICCPTLSDQPGWIYRYVCLVHCGVLYGALCGVLCDGCNTATYVCVLQEDPVRGMVVPDLSEFVVERVEEVHAIILSGTEYVTCLIILSVCTYGLCVSLFRSLCV